MESRKSDENGSD